MANNIPPGKLSARDQRKVNSLCERFQAQGIGEDDATRRAVEEVTKMSHSGAGGGRKSGGESKKHTKHGGRGRTGSRSSVEK